MLQKIKLAMTGALTNTVRSYEVQAHIFGKLAVHRPITRTHHKRSTWRITHLQTGEAITPSINKPFRNVCALAKAAMSLDWDFGRFGDHKRNQREIPKATHKGFLKLCKEHVKE